VIGIDIGKNSFYVAGDDARDPIALRQTWSRGQGKRGSPNIPALPDRHGSLRWRTSPEPETRIAGHTMPG
jgi:hypothetical protein